MKSYDINPIKLIAAITAELDRQHPGFPADGRFNQVIKAANIIVTEYARAYVPATPAMGLDAWLNSDDTGSSSLYMAFILSGGTFGNWWGRQIPQAAYPRDVDDLGRCLRLVDAVPEFAGIIPKMNDHGPEWSAVVLNWHDWEELYKAGNLDELTTSMQEAFAKASVDRARGKQ